jgi:hypothetical protein
LIKEETSSCSKCKILNDFVAKWLHITPFQLTTEQKHVHSSARCVFVLKVRRTNCYLSILLFTIYYLYLLYFILFLYYTITLLRLIKFLAFVNKHAQHAASLFAGFHMVDLHQQMRAADEIIHRLLPNG